MHHRPLPAFPSLSGRLVQEYDAERSDEVHRHARIHRKGAIDEEQRAPQEGSDHAASVESTDEPRPITKKGSYGGRTFEIAPMRFHTPFRVLWYQRSRASTYDTVQPTFHLREKARLNPYSTAYIVYPMRESVNVTKIASNRNSPWRSN